MPVDRFLGGAYASVHGPHDPRRLAIWGLEAGFRGFLPGPGPRAVDWLAVADLRADLPLRLPAVRVTSLASVPAQHGLAAAAAGEQRAAMVAIGDAVHLASQLGTRAVIVDPGLVPLFGEVGNEDLGDASVRWTQDAAHALVARAKAGRNAALDRVCRALHALGRQFPDTRLLLTTGRSLRSVADRQGLEAVFEDLGSLELGYWHDAAVVARRQQVVGEAAGEWLESFRNRLAGITLGDASPDGIYLVPGSGGVDWSLLANYVPSGPKSLPVVVELDPAVSPGELPGMRSFLDKFGL